MRQIVCFLIVMLVPLLGMSQGDDLTGKIQNEFSAEQKVRLKTSGDLINKADFYAADAEKIKSENIKKAVKLHEKAAKIYSKECKMKYALRKNKLDELRKKTDDIKETAFDFLYQEAVNSYRQSVSNRVAASQTKNKAEKVKLYQSAIVNNDKAFDYQNESFAVYFDLVDFQLYSEKVDYSEEALVNGGKAKTDDNETTKVDFTDKSFSTDENYTVIENNVTTTTDSNVTVTNGSATSSTGGNLYNADVIFKVQIAAAVAPMTDAALKRKYNKGAIQKERDGSYYKYLVGTYPNYQEAYNAKKTIGVNGAFVVAYKNGKRVQDAAEFTTIVPGTNSEIKSSLNSKEIDNSASTSSKAAMTVANAEGIEYRIQIATSRLPADKKQIADLNPTDLEVKIYKSSTYYKYTVGSFKTEAEAQMYRNAFGLSKSFIVKYKDNRQVN